MSTKLQNSLAFRFFFTLILCLLLFAAFEFYLRATATRIVSKPKTGKTTGYFEALYEYTADGRRLLPERDLVVMNHVISGLDVAIKSNRFGFRGEDFPLEKPANEKRILFLGDSITIEDYLNEEDTFIKIAENKLNEKNLVGARWRLINSGVGDIGIKEELNILEEKGLDVNPDLIVLNFYLNDSRPPWGFPEEVGHRGWLRAHSMVINALWHKFIMWKWVREQGANRFAWIAARNTLDWKNKKEDLEKLIELAKYDWGSAWRDEAWISIEKQLDKLQKLAALRNASVLVVGFPVSFQVYAQYEEDAPQRRIKQAAQQRGMEFFDLLPAMRQANRQELFYDQCHPNIVGNKIIAQQIEEKIKEIFERQR